jgi:hypothetical protein
MCLGGLRISPRPEKISIVISIRATFTYLFVQALVEIVAVRVLKLANVFLVLPSC